MPKTVIGVFATPDAARSAEDALHRRGIPPAAVRLSIAPGAEAAPPHHDFADGIRDFFSELFGTEHSEEAAHYSAAAHRGQVVVAVRLADDADPRGVVAALSDAGAIDIGQRI